ncbi:MAG: hypothetical protein PHR26_02790 [Candidatus ainarchaeum sp.]|nr:hypothetical protein [Candidatus ainarchaeum sp.]MDD3975587.1 hypothetical protein [Candidatus ainarchaeum sp.]
MNFKIFNIFFVFSFILSFGTVFAITDFDAPIVLKVTGDISFNDSTICSVNCGLNTNTINTQGNSTLSSEEELNQLNFSEDKCCRITYKAHGGTAIFIGANIYQGCGVDSSVTSEEYTVFNGVNYYFDNSEVISLFENGFFIGPIDVSDIGDCRSYDLDIFVKKQTASSEVNLFEVGIEMPNPYLSSSALGTSYTCNGGVCTIN